MEKNGYLIIILLISVFLMAVFARLTIELPLNELRIPVTGQSFAILLLAFMLGLRRGSLAIFIYLLAGAIGLPVFADGAGGISVFQKASAGFLIGFLPAGFLAGYLGDLGWRKSLLKCFAAMFLATALLMFCGVAYLSFKLGLGKALEFGFFPFIPGAIIKILLSALLAFFIQKNTMMK